METDDARMERFRTKLTEIEDTVSVLEQRLQIYSDSIDADLNDFADEMALLVDMVGGLTRLSEPIITKDS